MAEAAVESPISRFFCHKCAQEINPVLPDYTCPRCQSGFIEELSQGPDAGEESDEDVDPSVQFTEFWSEMLLDIFRRADVEQGRGRENGEAPARNSENRMPSQLQRNRRRRLALERLGSRGFRDSDRRTQGSEGLVQQILTLSSRYSPLVASTGFLNLHGNPGDYAWGRGGLDAVITQLLNQLDGTGPPPLPKEKIEEIPTVEIDKEQVDTMLQCTVCMEDFRLGEPVKKLSCLHHFHNDCIIPWLELHGTCPICRKLLLDEAANTQNFATLEVPSTSMRMNNGNNRRSETPGSGNGSTATSASQRLVDYIVPGGIFTSSNSSQPQVYDFSDDFD